MSGALVLAGVVALLVAVVRPWPMAVPFLLLWILSPLVARWVSLPPRTLGAEPVDDVERRALRAIGRRTWRFFETFVDAEVYALRRTTSRKIRNPSSRTARPRPTSGCICCPSSRRATSGGSGRPTRPRVSRRRSRRCKRSSAFAGTSTIGTTRTLRPLDPLDVSSVDSGNRAEIVRRDGAILTTLEIVVSPEDDAEVRRVSVGNFGVRTHEIELTSYAEIVLAPPAADAAHPVFSNLCVQTEFVHEVDGLLAMRRPRADGEAPVFAAHVVVVEGETVGGVQFETDRARFLGRGSRHPDADVGDRRSPALQHGGIGPRSDREPAPLGPAAARRDGAPHVLDEYTHGAIWSVLGFAALGATHRVRIVLG